MRFLTTYATDLRSTTNISTLTNSLVDLLAFCVSAGDTFLPDPSSYDDLFYKLVETGPIINRFRDAYALKSGRAGESMNVNLSAKDKHVAAIDTLISVSSHFHALLFHEDTTGHGTGGEVGSAPSTPNANTSANAGETQKQTPAPLPAARKKNLGPREVHRIIKQGYETLSIQSPEGLHAWTRWRETEWKGELKRGARYAVEDARELVV